MNIYFCGSIKGGRQDVKIFQKIVKKLQTYGQVFSHDDVSEKGEDSLPGGDEAIYDRDMEWLAQSDVVVAEVTHPSFGVGYEIGQAMVLKKRTLCLFRPSSGKVLPAMIQHAEAKMGSSIFKVRNYDEEEVDGILENYFGEFTKD
ncbi:5-hydroxymethyl-dUMP N-hydrolase-like isoform 1-T1 [Clarias gariepinus]|uniref:2'-deoxynucleoside 5'-phosphate N-hydrolase 1-like isoform X2 n=1 Tax=Clarias gariepinus TaxID=13013 RepID=UPI00234CD3C9|nr:2'-deoxynucleoside 5'-phosphate N-hydrolase 1-like isoform X2 [Clarias gariepinus]